MGKYWDTARVPLPFRKIIVLPKNADERQPVKSRIKYAITSAYYSNSKNPTKPDRVVGLIHGTEGNSDTHHSPNHRVVVQTSQSAYIRTGVANISLVRIMAVSAPAVPVQTNKTELIRPLVIDSTKNIIYVDTKHSIPSIAVLHFMMIFSRANRQMRYNTGSGHLDMLGKHDSDASDYHVFCEDGDGTKRMLLDPYLALLELLSVSNIERARNVIISSNRNTKWDAKEMTCKSYYNLVQMKRAFNRLMINLFDPVVVIQCGYDCHLALTNRWKVHNTHRRS